MTDSLVTDLAAACTGRVEGMAALAPLTTLRVGGPARVLVEAESDADIAAVGRVTAGHGVRCLVVGRGSNLLVADGGWDGVALRLGRGFRGVDVIGTTVVAGGAEPMPVLARVLAKRGLGGFAFAVAVPGSVGGGVRMNAGAHGREMVDVLVETDVVRMVGGARETWPAVTLGMRYRRTDLPDDAVVVTATLALASVAATDAEAELDEVKRWRREHQPVNEPSCGSVFTNPDGDSAGRLIEAAGAKGTSIGGATVSDRHANFIVTRPGATAADVRALIRLVRATVAERAGVVLHPEVVMVGDFGDSGLD